MSQYLYKAIIYTDTTNVIGLDTAQNTTDRTDYEGNNQAATLKITDLKLAETTFVTDLSYEDFDAMITTPYSWSDVKELSLPDRYELYLIT